MLCYCFICAVQSSSISYGTAGSTYSINFSTVLSLTGNVAATSYGTANVPAAINTGVASNVLTGSSSSSTNTSLNGWYVDSTAARVAEDTNTNTTTGAIYDFTNGTQAGLGITATSGNTATFGVMLVNTTGQTLSTVNLSFLAAEWRDGSTTSGNTLAFSYGVTSSVSGMLTNSGLTNVTSLNYVAPITGANAFTSGIGGTDSSNITGTLTGVNWGAGQALWIEWGVNGVSQGPSLAIDNFSLSASAAVAPSFTWNNHSGDSLWNTTSINWTNGANVAYSDAGGPTVTFTDVGAGAITVTGSGVNPGSVTVTNSGANTYTFTGGSIGGSASLTKQGNGLLALSASNGYTGGTAINGGTILIGNDNALGVSTSSLTMAGGSLRLSGNVTSARALTINTGGGTFDTNGNNATFSGPFSTGDVFSKVGVGSLTLTGAVSVNAGTGYLAVNAGTLNLAPASGGGTDSIFVSSTSGSFAGSIGVLGATVLNIQASGGTGSGVVGGGGTITFMGAAGSGPSSASYGGIITNPSGTDTVTVGNNIVLSPTGSVTSTGQFGILLGAGSPSVLAVVGNISGTGDVIISSTNTGVVKGAGNLILSGNNSYSGMTDILYSSNGVVQLGSNTALPTTTTLYFGNTLNGGAAAQAGKLDMNGWNATVSGISTASASGIINSSTSQSVLTILGGGMNTFAAAIGPTGDNIALTLATANTGSLALTNTSGSSFSGGTIVNGGTLFISNSSNSALGSGNVTIGSGGALASGVNATITGPSTVVVVSGVLSAGGGSVGTLTIGGGLQANSGSAFKFAFSGSSVSLVDVTGAMTFFGASTLNLSGTPTAGTYTLMTFGSDFNNASFSSIVGTPGFQYTETISGNNLEVTVSVSPLTWTSTTSGLKDGAGLWADMTASGGANFWNGAANVQWDNTQNSTVIFGATNSGNGGTVSLGSAITASTIIFSTVSSPYAIVGNGNSLTLTGGITASSSATIAAPVMITASETWTSGSGATLSVTGSIGEATAGQALTLTGSGAFAFSGANTYSGGTSVLGGATLQVSADNNLGAAAAQLTISGGTLAVTGSGFTTSRTIHITNTGGGGTFDIANGGTLTASTALAGSGTLTKTDGGALWLAGAYNTGANISVLGGTLDLAGAASLTGSLTISGGASLVFAEASGTETFNAAASAGSGQFGGKLVIGGDSAVIIKNAGFISDAGGQIQFTTSGGGLFANGTNVTIGNDVVLTGSGPISSFLGDSSGGTLTVAGNISGNGDLIVSSTNTGVASGKGVVVLSGNNTYSGNTIMLLNNTSGSYGLLQLGSNTALPTATTIIFGTGSSGVAGLLDMNGYNATVAGISAAFATGSSFGGIVNSSATLSTLTINGSGSYAYASAIGGDALATNSNSTSGTVSGSNVALVMAGTGTLTLSGINPYAGTTTINAGTLAVDGSLTSTSGVTVNTNGTLAGAGTINTAATVSLAGGMFAMTGGTVGAVQVTANSTWSGSATAASLSIDSGKNLNLSGTATITSAVDVSGSRLVNNGTVHATVNVSSGGVVNGNGSFDALNVNSGGSVSPGNSPGTLNSASTSWNSGGTYVWEINHLGSSFNDQLPAGQNPGWDLWNTNNLTAVQSGFKIEVESLLTNNSAGALTGWDPSQAYQWLIGTSTDNAFTPTAVTTLNGSLDYVTQFGADNNLAGGSFALIGGDSGNSLYLDFTPAAVPEPGTLLLGLIATSSIGWRIRRRRAQLPTTIAKPNCAAHCSDFS